MSKKEAAKREEKKEPVKREEKKEAVKQEEKKAAVKQEEKKAEKRSGEPVAKTAGSKPGPTFKYAKELRTLQVELVKLLNHIKGEGLRVAVLFEGRDAAGKGGTIKRITQYLNPRGARVVALEKPSDRERTQWYFQRYVAHLPTAGELVLFDRSWYNRAMVEPVMGFCSDEQYKRFLKDVPLFEQLLVKDGIRLLKYYFSVSKAEQWKRFESRKTDPLKQFKVSPVDLQAQALWNQYTVKKFQMLGESNRTLTPWTIIHSDDKKRARINCIKHLLGELDYEGKPDDDRLAVDPEIVVSGIDELKYLEDHLFDMREPTG